MYQISYFWVPASKNYFVSPQPSRKEFILLLRALEVNWKLFLNTFNSEAVYHNRFWQKFSPSSYWTYSIAIVGMGKKLQKKWEPAVIQFVAPMSISCYDWNDSCFYRLWLEVLYLERWRMLAHILIFRTLIFQANSTRLSICTLWVSVGGHHLSQLLESVCRTFLYVHRHWRGDLGPSVQQTKTSYLHGLQKFGQPIWIYHLADYEKEKGVEMQFYLHARHHCQLHRPFRKNRFD